MYFAEIQFTVLCRDSLYIIRNFYIIKTCCTNLFGQGQKTAYRENRVMGNHVKRGITD